MLITRRARRPSTSPNVATRLLPKALPLIATYGAPEPTHGSPAIMVRMSVRHCVEISSRGDGVRPYSNVLAVDKMAVNTRPRRTQPANRRRHRATRARLAREAITAARWRQLPRVSPLAGGPRPGRAGRQRPRPWPRPGRAGGRPPPQSSRCTTHTPVKHHGHRSLTHYQHRSSRTASSPSRTPRSAASARC